MNKIDETIDRILMERITKDKSALVIDNGDIAVQKTGAFWSISVGGEYRILSDKHLKELKKFFDMI